ncbi:MAG TPA: TfoX/Sxy family protein [Steroidobacter sp.]|uniref:TfoX/Sxy family protein n=1 Tax=Steroidobacter sp. TaxID=1978227 RepID=UPI002ED9AF40
MPVSNDYFQYVIEQLHRLPQLTSRRMFGAMGLYSSGVFFGIVDNDTLFFKVDDSTRESYTARGSEAFRPYKDRPDVSMSYFQVPVDILEDADELLTWARAAVRVAAAIAAAMPAPKKRVGKKQAPARRRPT